jgi:hypothetical protein
VNSVSSITVTAAPVHYNPIPGLNNDSLFHIMDFCSQVDICRLKRSCRYFKDLGSYYQVRLANKFPLAALGIKDAKATTFFLQSLGAYRDNLERLDLPHMQQSIQELPEILKVDLPNLKKLKLPKWLYLDRVFDTYAKQFELLLDIAIKTKYAKILHLYQNAHQSHIVYSSTPKPASEFKNPNTSRFIELMRNIDSIAYGSSNIYHLSDRKYFKLIGLNMLIMNLGDETISFYKELSQYFPLCLDATWIRIDQITNSDIDRIEKELPLLERLRYCCGVGQDRIPCIKTLKTLEITSFILPGEFFFPNLEELTIIGGLASTKIITAMVKRISVSNDQELQQIIAPKLKSLKITYCDKIQRLVTFAKYVDLSSLHQLQSVIIEEGAEIIIDHCPALEKENIIRLKYDEILALLKEGY